MTPWVVLRKVTASGGAYLCGVLDGCRRRLAKSVYKSDYKIIFLMHMHNIHGRFKPNFLFSS